MTVTRPAAAADLDVLAAIEGAADALFPELLDGVDWPPPTPGAARAGQPGILVVAAEDDAIVVPWNAPFHAAHGYAVREPPPATPSPFLAAEEAMGLARHGRRVAMGGVRGLLSRS